MYIYIYTYTYTYTAEVIAEAQLKAGPAPHPPGTYILNKKQRNHKHIMIIRMIMICFENIMYYQTVSS